MTVQWWEPFLPFLLLDKYVYYVLVALKFKIGDKYSCCAYAR